MSLSRHSVKHSSKNKKSTRFPRLVDYQHPIENDAPRRVFEACKSLRGDCWPSKSGKSQYPNRPNPRIRSRSVLRDRLQQLGNSIPFGKRALLPARRSLSAIRRRNFLVADHLRGRSHDIHRRHSESRFQRAGNCCRLSRSNKQRRGANSDQRLSCSSLRSRKRTRRVHWPSHRQYFSDPNDGYTGQALMERSLLHREPAFSPRFQ